MQAAKYPIGRLQLLELFEFGWSEWCVLAVQFYVVELE